MKEYEVPEIWEAALAMIDHELSRVQWNKTQKNYPSPFSNTGNNYTNSIFEVYAYDWSVDLNDDVPLLPYNFKWKDVEISWYKYLGRGMSANKDLSPELASICLIECLKSIREEDVTI